MRDDRSVGALTLQDRSRENLQSLQCSRYAEAEWYLTRGLTAVPDAYILYTLSAACPISWLVEILHLLCNQQMRGVVLVAGLHRLKQVIAIKINLCRVCCAAFQGGPLETRRPGRALTKALSCSEGFANGAKARGLAQGSYRSTR